MSRTHKGFLRRLFELEVPEIHSGTVEIKAIAREAGSRSKVAVASRQDGLDPVGATVGQRGARVQAVVAELAGEKIDVIPWSDDAGVFVANALSPAQVLSVDIDEEHRIASVTVPERMLSLAIGREGQNARLAARLTGWRIDIRSDVSVAEAKAAADAAGEAEPVAAGRSRRPPAPRQRRGARRRGEAEARREGEGRPRAAAARRDRGPPRPADRRPKAERRRQAEGGRGQGHGRDQDRRREARRPAASKADDRSRAAAKAAAKPKRDDQEDRRGRGRGSRRRGGGVVAAGRASGGTAAGTPRRVPTRIVRGLSDLAPQARAAARRPDARSVTSSSIRPAGWPVAAPTCAGGRPASTIAIKKGALSRALETPLPAAFLRAP